MFARVTTIQGSPDQVEEATRFIKEQIIPMVQQMEGLKGGYWMVDRSTGKGMGITLWESEEIMRSNEEKANQLRNQSSQTLSGTPTVEVYEIFAQV